VQKKKKRDRLAQNEGGPQAEKRVGVKHENETAARVCDSVRRKRRIALGGSRRRISSPCNPKVGLVLRVSELVLATPSRPYSRYREGRAENTKHPNMACPSKCNLAQTLPNLPMHCRLPPFNRTLPDAPMSYVSCSLACTFFLPRSVHNFREWIPQNPPQAPERVVNDKMQGS
jgi:hypothetical protein